MRNGAVLLIMIVRLACDLIDKPMAKAQFWHGPARNTMESCRSGRDSGTEVRRSVIWDVARAATLAPCYLERSILSHLLLTGLSARVHGGRLIVDVQQCRGTCSNGPSQRRISRDQLSAAVVLTTRVSSWTRAAIVSDIRARHTYQAF